MIRISRSFLISTKASTINTIYKPTLLSNLQLLNKPITYAPKTSLTMSLKCAMASKKKEDKDEKKKKEKEKIKQQIGGDVTEIDLNKYEQPYQRIQKAELENSMLPHSTMYRLRSEKTSSMQNTLHKSHLKALSVLSSIHTTPTIWTPYKKQSKHQTILQKALSVSLPNSSIQELKKKMVQKIKKSLQDQKELLKKQRHVCHEDLKKYEKIAQKDKLRQIEKQAKQLYDKFSDMLDKLAKDKEKQLMK